jgi:Flp pilus assembly pilin Flp
MNTGTDRNGNSARDRPRRLRRGERGDVLLEYVLLTVLIVLPLVGASTGFFNPSGRTFDVEGALGGEDFGSFGTAFVQLYRLVMSGVCLPLP